MLMFTLAISFDRFQLTLIHAPTILGSYALLFFTASAFTSITGHIHNWVLFLLWHCLFILSGVISPLFSSSILDIYQPGEFIFQCYFHAVHGVLKARILKWFAIPFSTGPCFVRTLHCDPSILSGPIWHAHSFIELDKAVVMWSVWSVFCNCSFHSVGTLSNKDKRLTETPWWARPNVGETGSCLVMLNSLDFCLSGKLLISSSIF